MFDVLTTIIVLGMVILAAVWFFIIRRALANKSAVESVFLKRKPPRDTK